MGSLGIKPASFYAGQKYQREEAVFVERMKHTVCMVPQQDNWFDCGLFSIAFAQAAMDRAARLCTIVPSTGDWESQVQTVFGNMGDFDAAQLRKDIYSFYQMISRKCQKWAFDSPTNHAKHFEYCGRKGIDLYVRPTNPTQQVIDLCSGSMMGHEEKKEDNMLDELSASGGRHMDEEEELFVLSRGVDLLSQVEEDGLQDSDDDMAIAKVTDACSGDAHHGHEVAMQVVEEERSVISSMSDMDAILDCVVDIFQQNIQARTLHLLLAQRMTEDPNFYNAIIRDFKFPVLFFNKTGKYLIYFLLNVNN